MGDRDPRLRLIAQIGSAVAVALSLAFVAIEVRETSQQTALNTSALQVAAYQDLIGQIDEWNRTILDPEVAALWRRVRDPNGSWADLAPVEQTQANALLFLLIRHSDMAYYQYERGVISEERLLSVLTPFLANLRFPIVRARWELAKANYLPDFTAYIDRRIGDVGN